MIKFTSLVRLSGRKWLDKLATSRHRRSHNSELRTQNSERKAHKLLSIPARLLT